LTVSIENTFALKLDNLTVRYGPGCPLCLDEETIGARMERNR
jgi:hypothetical protein